MSTIKCRICSQNLTIELDPDDFNEATSSSAGGSSGVVPDDLLLSCGCHFHCVSKMKGPILGSMVLGDHVGSFDNTDKTISRKNVFCLLDESPRIAISLACPACNTSIIPAGSGPSATNQFFSADSQQPQVLTRYHNEGGIEENLDILPLITEEAYLDANPAARPARAFMTMCGEGDIAGIIELLKAIEEDPDEGDMSPADLLRYQDPLDALKTGLHVAVERTQQESVWLLLWLASGLQTQVFPEEVSQAAEVMGASRATAQGSDIRGLRDKQGRTAEDVAKSLGSTWAVLLGAGILQG